MKTSNTVQKEYQTLSFLLINTIGKQYIFYHIEKTRKDLNQIINQFLLTLYMFLTILKN